MSYQNNIIEALKKLYVALGGEAADVANLNITPEIINAIAEIVDGGGGSDLPDVTAADNYRVLQAINGAWAKGRQLLPALYATFTYEQSTEEWTCDTTAEQVIAYIAGGNTVCAKVQVAENTVAILPVTGLMYNEGDIFGVAFSAVAAADSADVRAVTSAYIGYSALGISCSIQTGYLSASDPNT